MRRNKIVLSLLFAGMGTAATAQNINLPIIQTKYTADPAPYVHNDTVYLYTTHDEDGAEGFLMKDWLLYTSTDMVNWQDRGAVASLKDFKWFKGENGAWAEQVIERNGNYYIAYASTCCPEGIGYAMSKNPLGPWEYKGHIMNHTPRTRGNHPGSIEIRLDGVNGQCIGKVDISNTKDEYKIFSTQVKKVKGVHDLYFVFKGGDIQKQNLFFLDWWKFGELL